jgi:hypothetical protein
MRISDRSNFAHKAEHSVDMDTGAVVAVTFQEAHLATPPR